MLKRISAVTQDSDLIGDFWTFVALDADTRLVPSYRIGKRTRATANAFLRDLAGRLAVRPQISADLRRQ